MKWEEMSPRERDALVEQTMGFEREGWAIRPRYTEDISAAWEVQENVGDWPVQERDRYVDELVLEVAGTAILDHPDDRWAAIHATPEQRCLAALRAKGVEI